MKKLVIVPGGFHPFHAGHKALYDAAVAAFPTAEVYIAATADTSSRPFPIELKKKLARLAGIPQNRFIQVKSPFRAEEITQHYDPENTVLIFARSEKDQDSQPKPGGVKKDGTPAYLQPYKRNGLQPMNKHGYMIYLPTVQFGPGMSSATEIRSKWPTLTPELKAKLVNQLYPATEGNEQLTGVTVKMLDQVLGNAVDEAVLVNDPEAGVQIRPDGGMGTWSEDALVSNLARKFASMVDMLKGKSYTSLEHVLYQGGVVESMVKALAQLQRFQEKQGRRPIARGREIDIGENEMDEAKKQRMRMPEPRNFVAKNAPKTGAGAHKDMKLAQKQGDVKHKKSLIPVDEAPDYMEEGDVVQFPGQTPPEGFEQAKALGLKMLDLLNNEAISDPTQLLLPIRQQLRQLGFRVRFSNRGAELVNDQAKWSTVLDPLN